MKVWGLVLVVNIVTAADVLKIYESSFDEILHPLPTKTTGQVPKWLKTLFLRNGPGSFEMPHEKSDVLPNWFDGFTKFERWAISNGQVDFSTRFLESQFYLKSKAKQTPNQAETIGLFTKAPEFSDNYNVFLWEYNQETLTPTSDFRSFNMYKIDRNDLSTSKFNFQDKFHSPLEFTPSHPHHLVENTNITITFSINPLPIPFLGRNLCLENIHKDKLSRDIISCSRVQTNPLVHSFALTKHFAIVYENPVQIIFIKSTITGITEFEEFPGKPAYVHVFPLDGSQPFKPIPVSTDAPLEKCFHVINAFDVQMDDKTQIFMDWECFDVEGSFVPPLLDDHVPDLSFTEDSVSVRRFEVIVDRKQVLSAKKVEQFNPTDETGREYALQFPRFNYDYRGRRSCFVYSMIAEKKGRQGYGLGKTDVCLSGDEPSIIQKWYVEGHMATEPIFVPRPNSDTEDDGVILSSVFDSFLKKKYLLILDATTFEVLSRSYTTIQSFAGFHGNTISISD